jgi:hypothetical protein
MPLTNIQIKRYLDELDTALLKAGATHCNRLQDYSLDKQTWI